MMAIDMRPKAAGEMKKTVSVFVNSVSLTIYGPIEWALPEMKATGAEILAVGGGRVRGDIEFDIDELEKALAKAEEMVANGWEWE